MPSLQGIGFFFVRKFKPGGCLIFLFGLDSNLRYAHLGEINFSFIKNRVLNELVVHEYFMKILALALDYFMSKLRFSPFDILLHLVISGQQKEGVYISLEFTFFK
jgi:hypothetical protein